MICKVCEHPAAAHHDGGECHRVYCSCPGLRTAQQLAAEQDAIAAGPVPAPDNGRSFFPDCTPECAVAVPCPICGRDLPPRGRSVAPETNLSHCCEEHRYDAANTRHLWSVAELEDR